MQRTDLNKQVVTSVSLLDERVIRPEIIDNENTMDWAALMAFAGLKVETKFSQYSQWTDEPNHKVVVIDTGGVTGSGTATLTITLTAATSGYARKNMVLKFPNDKCGIVSSAITVSGGKDSFTVKSCDGTNLTAVAGGKMIDLGTSAGEGSDAVDNITYTPTSDFNLLQRLRTTDKITDVQKQSYITAKAPDGTMLIASYEKYKKAQAFQLDISAALFAQQKSATQYGDSVPLVDGQGKPTQFTGGIDQEIATKGASLSAWTTLGTFVMGDLDNECDGLNAIKAPNEYLKICPDKAKREFGKFAKALGSSGVQSAKLNFNSNEITAFNFNVSSIEHGRFKFEYACLPMMDMPEKFGSGVGTIGKSVYGIPKGNVQTVGNGVIPRVRVRYMPHGFQNAGNSWIAEWEEGGMAKTPTNGSATLQTHWLCNFGNEMAGTRHFTKQSALS